ncbi:MAG: SIS domain-containing protein, partial [Calditrichia bacterium]
MSKQWKQNVQKLCDIFIKISIWDNSGNVLYPDVAFEKWKEMTLKIRENDKTVFFVGNGASASMASHFAADVAKNAGIRTNVFTDTALMTALANDISYEEVYAEPLRWNMKKGDMLVAISSSGNSPNIVRAVNTAKSLNGTVVTLSAMGEGNAIRKLGDLNFYVPAQTYGMAETAH